MPGYFFFFGGYEVTRKLLANPNESKDDIGWQKTMVAGAVGGTVLWLVIFPADVIKSRIQVSSISCNLNNINQKYDQILYLRSSNSPLQVKNIKAPALVVLKDIVRNEGISSLYNGLKPTLIRTVPATATLFVTYEYTRKLMLNFFENS